MSKIVDLILLTAIYAAVIVWFGTEDPERAKRQGMPMTAEFAEKSRWALDRVGFTWVYDKKTPFQCMEYDDDGTHLVEILDDWIPYAARSAISDELATLGEHGFPLAPIHTHSEQANFTVAGLAYPGSVGDANNEEDGGCPVGSAKVGKECLLRPRADVERNYVARGGENKQAETVPRLLARLQLFRIDIPIQELTARRSSLTALFSGDTNFGRNTTDAAVHVNREILAVAAKLHSEIEKTETVVHPIRLSVEAILPWMEIATATDTPTFVGKPPAIPEWLQTVMRHSCSSERHRVHTIRGYSWWPASGSPGLACDGECQSHPNHRGVFYREGTHEVPSEIGSDRQYGSQVLFDPQTIMHGVRATQAAPTCLEPSGQQMLPTGSRLVAVTGQDGNITTWRVVSRDNSTLFTIPADQIAFRVGWEAVVVESESAFQQWLDSSTKRTVTLSQGTRDVLDALRSRGLLKFVFVTDVL
eukprot:m.121553 g.121553  ORF g.121553 m.121553 type:complete len:474 (+) comp13388_c0_seq4:238-1659(+)